MAGFRGGAVPCSVITANGDAVAAWSRGELTDAKPLIDKIDE